MSSSRIRFNRAVFAIAASSVAEQLLKQLSAEDIEAVVDVRQANGEPLDRLAAACEDVEMYYVHRPDLVAAAGRGERHGQPDAHIAWAASIALRHRTCVLTDGGASAMAVAEAVARVGGMRLVDLNTSPAPIALAGA